MSNDHRFALTYDQICAANELYDLHLPNWRFAAETFRYLKDKMDFGRKEDCLLAVVAVDALYSTGLRYRPGRVEEVACRVCDENLPANKNVHPQHVEKISEDFRPSPISFFSKFFHFFVSNDYPIFDELARTVLKRIECSNDNTNKTYSQFFCGIDKLRQQIGNGVSVSEIDRYLWLTGKYIAWKNERSKKIDLAKKSKKYVNEVNVLFTNSTPEQRELLGRLTNGDYDRSTAT